MSMQHKNHVHGLNIGQHAMFKPADNPVTRHWIIATILLAVFLLCGLWAVNVYTEARYVEAQEKVALASLKSLSKQAKPLVKAEGVDGLRKIEKHPDFIRAQKAAALADNVTQGLSWRILSFVPGIGDDIQVARTLTHTAHVALNEVAPQFIQPALKVADSKFTKNGKVDLTPLITAQKSFNSANATVQQLASQVKTLPSAHVSQLQAARTQVAGKLVPAAQQLNAAMTTYNELMKMMTSSKPHTLLLVAATTAEVHASTGLVGSIGSLTLGNNKIEFGDFHANTEFESQGDVIRSAEAWHIFNEPTWYYTMDIRDATIDPDFNNAATYIINTWQRSKYKVNPSPIGVLMVDPMFVQELIRQSGSIQVPDLGLEINGDNAATYLQNKIYIDIPHPTIQDKIFALVISHTVSSIMDDLNAKTITGLLKVIPEYAKQRHISLYFTDKKLQPIADALGMTQRAQYSEKKPQLGIYINSHMPSKMDFYADRRAEIKQISGPTKDGVKGKRKYEVTYSVTNTLDYSTLFILPEYISGASDPGHLVENLLVYPPKGGTVKYTGDEVFDHNTWNKKHFIRNLYNIDLGETKDYHFIVSTSAQAEEGLTIDQSPMAH